ncbi:MAG TPA: hypothetical protein ENJ96_10225 [Thermodesulfatator atlanticus]|uniref:Uncharacterized protein n=1 Tax=Thermodesulfatator atlanticus TaxID=501497 RepID=A0A7V5U3I2_9BACT|nr:hypothetical protein [Thermodesulfatator atlanticus]
MKFYRIKAHLVKVTAEEILARKLSLARRFFEKYRQNLLKEPKITELLTAHGKAFARAQEVTIETGAASFCARCGREGRSCCGADMELHCDDALLVANLLAGVDFPRKRLWPKACFFLGPAGCVLKIRPLICRNFICPELATALGPEKVSSLQEALEEEARLLFWLTEEIKRWLIKGL